MVAGLAARLEQTPDDVAGWLRLANAYRQLGQADRAIKTLADLAGRQPDRLDVQLAYAQALYPPEAAATAAPPREFLGIMRRVLTLDPGNAEALWFVARDTAPSDPTGAKALLSRLLARLPADSPARATVEQEVSKLGG
jgi:cytochrome c-type biogenesis protein CcmH